MSELSSVNKIKSLTQQIEVVTGKSHSDLTVAIQALKDGYGNSEGGNGSGSGIIDVTELPTTDIDENAVYRVTENIQTSITELYGVTDGQVMTVNEYLAMLGVPTIPNIYVIDDLSEDLKTSDVVTFSELNIYILRSNGVAYFNAPELGGLLTFGMMAFQEEGYDKGFTENAYAETEAGVYTTIEAYTELVRYFIRKSGEWEEISAVLSGVLPNGLNNVEALSGVYQSEVVTVQEKIVDIKSLITKDRIIPSVLRVDIPTIGDFITGFYISEITPKDFIDSNGRSITWLRNHAFHQLSSLEKITFPESITYISSYCCNNCPRLKEVVFPETLERIGEYAFEACYELLPDLVIPSGVTSISSRAFASCPSLTTVTFKGTPSFIADNVFLNSGVTTINVPWGEGEQANCPWGATNATINYNYTGG